MSARLRVSLDELWLTLAVVLPALAVALVAQIALYPTYLGADSSSRNAFVAWDDSGTATGGIYRFTDATPKLIKGARAGSVAYDGTNLLAGDSGGSNDSGFDLHFQVEMIAFPGSKGSRSRASRV